jgi:hypothetical protein
METISNVAAAASKAIWGEQTATQQNETAGQEPISGQQGKGTANEPFDQGNTGKLYALSPVVMQRVAHITRKRPSAYSLTLYCIDLSTQKSENASQEPISSHLTKTPTAEPVGQGYSGEFNQPDWPTDVTEQKSAD